MLDALRAWIADAPLLLVGTLAAIAASLGTSVGAVPIFVIPRVPRAAQDVLMSTAAGIMLAATAYSLVLPGLEEAEAATGSALGGAAVVAAGVFLGAVVIALVHRYAPHEHFVKGRDTAATDVHRLRQVWLFVIAITLHNFPEGLAVGVGFGGGRVDNGLALTTAIFIQNMPEGFVVALALLGQGYSRWRSGLIACATGLVETVGGVVGASAVSLAVTVLPWGLAFAAGAMLFVVSHEIIPETHRGGYETHATFGLVAGFVAMLLLEAALG